MIDVYISGPVELNIIIQVIYLLNIFLKFIKLFSPEFSHVLALKCLNIAYKTGLLGLLFPQPEIANVDFAGMKLANKLGTAAGLDKNGDYIDCLGALGFGFLEIGTVTPLPQSGNKKPRVFRVRDESAIINRLGFNNKGVDYLVKNLKQKRYTGIVGVNIGANKQSKEKNRIEDYLICIRKVYKFSDYITVNISSPNTKNLRDLHNSKNMDELIEKIDIEIKKLKISIPIFIKVSPDETKETLKYLIDKIIDSSLEGVIATNTTVDKTLLKQEKYHTYNGGLSGSPLSSKSNEVISYIRSLSRTIPIIGVGGVLSNNDYEAKINAGANIVQIYSGLIINGPSIIFNILRKNKRAS